MKRFFIRLSDLLEHQRVFGDVRNQDFVPQGDDRLGALRSLQIEKVFYKGLPGYKQVLMHEKYPHQYHSDDLYKKPSEEVLKSEKEDQDQRRKYKKMRRKDSRIALLSASRAGSTTISTNSGYISTQAKLHL
jgi:hypothetical protein